jgi:hypothetical protein
MLTRSSVAPAVAGRQQRLQTTTHACKSLNRSSRHIVRVATPAREQVVDVDNAERARLESSDAFAELVALTEKKQSVNRPQKVRSHCAVACRSVGE